MDNGSPQNTQPLGWGENSSTLDDFYVNSGGWYIDRTETFGIPVNATDAVAEVELKIRPHDYDENMPDGDDLMALNVTGFTADLTGQVVLDRYVIKLTVDFEREFLPSQEYYSLELLVRDQHGHENFKGLSRHQISNDRAWNHFGGGTLEPTYANENARDLSYKLYADKVNMIDFGPKTEDLVSETRETETFAPLTDDYLR